MTLSNHERPLIHAFGTIPLWAQAWVGAPKQIQVDASVADFLVKIQQMLQTAKAKTQGCSALMAVHQRSYSGVFTWTQGLAP